MDMLQNLNHAMHYIEEHLCEDIELAALARIAGCSAHHFRRMFSYVAGLPLSEYIRRRRLSQAAAELQTSGIKVVDAAVKYGYDSPTAFARAFQALHGATPTAARESGAALTAYPVMTFHLSIKGGVQMNYRVVEKGPLAVAGYKKTMPLVDGDEDFAAINAMWAALTEEQAAALLALTNGAMEGLIGVSANNNGTSFDYYIACTTNEDVKPPAPLETLTIPATTWGCFEAKGPLPGSIVDTWKRIFTEWFPTSGYESTPLPTIEIYAEGDATREDYTCELWLPLAKQK